MSDGPEWFAQKRYGYGAGLPISWQGWAITIFYLAVVIILSITFRSRVDALIASIILPTVAFIVIAARTTRGGWRWRWGNED